MAHDPRTRPVHDLPGEDQPPLGELRPWGSVVLRRPVADGGDRG